MKRKGYYLVRAVAGGALAAALVLGSSPATASPEIEILPGSGLQIVGAEGDVASQVATLVPAPGAGRSTSSTVLAFPRLDLAFGEYVDVTQNQDLAVTLDPTMGHGTVDLVLWISDSDDNRVEVPVQLTTGLSTSTACNGNPFCLGDSGDPNGCTGEAWSASTGEARFVGRAVVPDGSDSIVECFPLTIDLRVAIDPLDGDGDGYPDALDGCPGDADPAQADSDGDGVGDACDNCPGAANSGQRDADDDGTGDACQPLRVNFQPQGAAVPSGYLRDHGAGYDGTDGYGWIDSPLLALADREMLPDQRLDTVGLTDVGTWEAQLPPGHFDVECAIGDPALGHGPQRVSHEDVVVFEDVSTAAGEQLVSSGQVRIGDGRLTVGVGTGTADTSLAYLVAQESATQPFVARYVNFQPSASPVPPGFEADTGSSFGAGDDFGWDVAVGNRDRGVLGDPVLDTLVFAANPPRTWRIEVPPDFYRVELTIGDSQFAKVHQRVVVEGETWVDDGPMAAGEFVTVRRTLLVLDGELDVEIGSPAGNTMLDYVTVESLPRDVDGDGFDNLADICLEIANPGQEDADGDGIGDACNDHVDFDGDDWADTRDNCPSVANALQEDGDGDTTGDVCDCAPSDDQARTQPVTVGGVRLTGGASTALSWDDQASVAGAGVVYDVVTGTLVGGTTPFTSVSCLASAVSGASAGDVGTPPAGSTRFYLVRASNVCGDGGLGAGTAREALDTADPCF